MNKIALSIGVLMVYAIYSLGMRHQHPLIAKPKNLSTSAPSSNTSTSNSVSSSGSSTNSNPTQSSSTYKDGTYVGSVDDAYYGNVQVSVTISGGKIQNVNFLQYPNSHSTSVYINQQAMPYLKQEAVQAQSSNVQIISGATFTTQAFAQSLQDALNKA